MEEITDVEHWLMMTLEQPVGAIHECFYYDKKLDQFFSIMAWDYFMLEEDFTRAEGVTSSYTITEENEIIDWIKRIENEDTSVIHIIRVGLDQRKALMQQFAGPIANDDLAIKLQRDIANQNYKAKFDFDFGNDIDEEIKQRWQDTKTVFLLQAARNFLHNNGIDINTAAVWYPGPPQRTKENNYR